MLLSLPRTAVVPPPAERLTIALREGLVGFPDWRNFVLTPVPSHGALLVLTSLDEEGLRFYATDPRPFAPAVATAIPDEDLAALGLPCVEAALVLALLTIGRRSSRVTANLLGPLVINPVTGAARQVVLADAGFSTRHPLPAGSLRL